MDKGRLEKSDPPVINKNLHTIMLLFSSQTMDLGTSTHSNCEQGRQVAFLTKVWLITDMSHLLYLLLCAGCQSFRHMLPSAFTVGKSCSQLQWVLYRYPELRILRNKDFIHSILMNCLVIIALKLWVSSQLGWARAHWSHEQLSWWFISRAVLMGFTNSYFNYLAFGSPKEYWDCLAAYGQ